MSYGNPIFRFRLIHEQAGIFEISEPDGWKDAKLQLLRDQDKHSLIEGFVGGFIFYGDNGQENGGINVIREIKRLYGLDADLTLDVDVSFDSGITYEDIYTGLYDFTLSEETNKNKVKSGINQTSFWSKFIARFETPVNLQDPKDLDGNNKTIITPENVNLSSQIIDQYGQFEQNEYVNFGRIYDVTEIDPSFQVEIANGQSVQFDFYNPILDEIDDKFSIPIAPVPVGGEPAEIYAVKFGGTYEIDVKICLTHLEYDAPAIRDYKNLAGKMDLFIQFNHEAPIPLTRVDDSITFLIIPSMTSQTNEWSAYTYSGTKLLNAGDTIKIFGTNVSGGDFGYANNSITVIVDQLIMLGNLNNDIQWQPAAGISGVYKTDFGTPPGVESFINILGHTVFEDTGAFGFTLHDAAYAITDRIAAPFYSEYFGSQMTNARQYQSDGCGWKNVIVKGLQLRRYTLPEKPFFMSFKQWWEGANPIFNLGLGYDNIGGQDVIRVEPKEFFYNEEMIVTFDYVFDVVKRYDDGVIFNKVDIGYKKWEAETTSGIDDPQTKHSYATRFKKIGTPISIESDFIAASLAIEETRRQTLKKSQDYKLDNDTFIIAVEESDSSPGRLIPELSENFSSITNLLNADTRYNTRLTPARNFLRWVNFLNGCLQDYVGSLYKFVSGQGNFDTTTDLIDTTPDCGEVQTEVSEKQDIPVTTEFLHLPDLLEITIEMSWEDYVTIRENPNNAVGFSQTNENHIPCFIKDLQYELCKSRAVFQVWPKEPFYITNTDFVAPTLQCAQTFIPETGCTDAILTELLEELVTEAEDCLILN